MICSRFRHIGEKILNKKKVKNNILNHKKLRLKKLIKISVNKNV